MNKREGHHAIVGDVLGKTFGILDLTEACRNEHHTKCNPEA
jgi:hypothetical protein